MPKFRVEWKIDIEAGTPERAARIALQIQRDAESTATVFDVFTVDARGIETDCREIDVAEIGEHAR